MLPGPETPRGEELRSEEEVMLSAMESATELALFLEKIVERLSSVETALDEAVEGEENTEKAQELANALATVQWIAEDCAERASNEYAVAAGPRHNESSAFYKAHVLTPYGYRSLNPKACRKSCPCSDGLAERLRKAPSRSRRSRTAVAA